MKSGIVNYYGNKVVETYLNFNMVDVDFLQTVYSNIVDGLKNENFRFLIENLKETESYYEFIIDVSSINNNNNSYVVIHIDKNDNEKSFVSAYDTGFVSGFMHEIRTVIPENIHKKFLTLLNKTTDKARNKIN